MTSTRFLSDMKILTVMNSASTMCLKTVNNHIYVNRYWNMEEIFFKILTNLRPYFLNWCSYQLSIPWKS